MIWLLLGLFCLLVSLVIGTNWRIEHYAEPFVYDQLEQIPTNTVGLLLGTSRKLADGRANLYFKYRIQAAVALYQAGKVNYLLVSGDNGSRHYNEPMDMKKALMKQGVPDSAIILDYAGFRTLDSVVRARKVFGQQQITVISQAFHNKRAIYLAHQNGLAAIGYNAPDVRQWAGFKTQVREVLARFKVFLDLYVLHTQPRFLGPPVLIGKP
ncbi:MAG: ElyC/SanA/YdcF family protein [Microscillaceae bacterium]